MEKETLEKELETLSERYNILAKKIIASRQAISDMEKEALLVKGAKEEVEKLLAFYNNENKKESEENNDDNK